MKYLLLIPLVLLFFSERIGYVQAATQILPSTFFCVGSNLQPPCATIAPTQSTGNNISPTGTSVTASPSNTVSSSPSSTETSPSPANPSPTTSPCSTTQSSVNGQSRVTAQATKRRRSKQRKPEQQGFLQQFIQLLLQLLQQLFKQLGIQIQLPGTNPCPTPSSSPSVAPTSSVSPSVSSSPSTGSPTNGVTTVAPTSASTTTTGKYIPPNGDVYIAAQSTAGEVASFDTAAGITSHPAIVGNYTAADGAVSGVINQYTSITGAAVMVSWNVTMTNNQITNGSEDSYLQTQAAAIKSYGKPVFLRIDWEMNGTWYPTYDLSGGTTAASYIASWQHIYTLFKNAGVTNAAFVWCPNVGDPAGQSVASWYPGDNYVDWIGVDGYPQFGSSASYLTGADGMNDMASLAAQHAKPLILAEWAPNSNSAFSDTVAPIDTVFNWAAAYPNTVKALMYFNFGGSGSKSATDFLLADHPIGAAEFRKFTAGNSKFLYTLVQ